MPLRSAHPQENLMKAIVAVLVSTFVFGGAFAQTPDRSGSPHASGSAMANPDAKRNGAVEKHIKDLHATLKITPAEESQWNEDAETMRENAIDLDRAIDKREANVASATAIDGVKRQAGVVKAHANGEKKRASAFCRLYSVKSDDQKKEGDEVFSHGSHE